ncbi:hypothetical protein HI914_03808 [Erysiphe necator]|nr:hypothetical protein HI914_03808 [Erysiphe necator]
MLNGNIAWPPQAPDGLSYWYEKKLGSRLGLDLMASFSAAIAIIQNASGQETLVRSLRSSCSMFLFRPHQIILSKPFFFISLLYSGTYLTANTTDTISSTVMNKSASEVTREAAKFTTSSIANISLGLIKDSKFVQLFGSQANTLKVPSSSLILFSLRDCLTIFASFNVPTLLGPVITRQFSPKLQHELNGQTIVQFTAPAAIQLLSTPLHLLGLDLYNRQDTNIRWSQRWLMVKKNWAISTVARMARIIPAFGIGGIVNAGFRETLIANIDSEPSHRS